jgi:hypothetical protein
MEGERRGSSVVVGGPRPGQRAQAASGGGELADSDEARPASLGRACMIRVSDSLLPSLMLTETPPSLSPSESINVGRRAASNLNRAGEARGQGPTECGRGPPAGGGCE